MQLETTTRGNTTYLIVPGYNDDDGDTETLVRCHKVVCPRCQGRGTHVNPAVDGHGLSREDFDQDPDFEDAYLSGVYDIVCDKCQGRNVIDEPDDSDPNFEVYVAWRREEAEYRAEVAAERRMGA